MAKNQIKYTLSPKGQRAEHETETLGRVTLANLVRCKARCTPASHDPLFNNSTWIRFHSRLNLLTRVEKPLPPPSLAAAEEVVHDVA